MPDGFTLPEHSPLGASSAERWMRCSGSVALIQALGPIEADEPDYRRDGTQAHALAAHCLNANCDAWEAMGEFDAISAEMADAVQVYLNYVRSLGGDRYVEHRVHRPEFHPQFYGTVDFAAVSRVNEATEIVDYKHGVGVVVEARDNPQLKYYAYGFIGDGPTADLPVMDGETVKLTIVQPRALWHPDGVIRSWETTAGDIRRWAREVLRPAMERAGEQSFELGEHCRFCPAKLVCPAMRHLASDAAMAQHETASADRLLSVSDNWLGDWFKRLSVLNMFISAVEQETYRRLIQGDHPALGAYAKLVARRSDRVFKEGAPVEERFGPDAFVTRLRSVAEIEKLPGGKEFVAEYAYKPDTGLTAVSLSDRRPAVAVLSTEEKFQKGIDKLASAG